MPASAIHIGKGVQNLCERLRSLMNLVQIMGTAAIKPLAQHLDNASGIKSSNGVPDGCRGIGKQIVFPDVQQGIAIDLIGKEIQKEQTAYCSLGPAGSSAGAPA